LNFLELTCSKGYSGVPFNRPIVRRDTPKMTAHFVKGSLCKEWVFSNIEAALDGLAFDRLNQRAFST
jgi:hypothetical protein